MCFAGKSTLHILLHFKCRQPSVSSEEQDDGLQSITAALSITSRQQEGASIEVFTEEHGPFFNLVLLLLLLLLLFLKV